MGTGENMKNDNFGVVGYNGNSIYLVVAMQLFNRHGKLMKMLQVVVLGST